MLDSKGKDANEVRYVAMLYLRSIRKYTYGSIVYICSFIGGSFGSIIPKYYRYILYPAKDLDCVMTNCAIL